MLMPLRISIALLLLFSSLSVIAQTDTVVRFTNYNGEEVEEGQSTFYIKVFKASPGDVLYRRLRFTRFEHKLVAEGWSKDKAGKIKQGAYIGYAFTKTVIDSGRYENDQKDGVWTGYHENGVVSYLYHYRSGTLFGRNFRWSDEKKITDSIILDDNGNGPAYGIYENGKKDYIGSYSGGKKSGAWTYYHNVPSNGKALEATYEADSVIRFTCYDEDGEFKKKKCEYNKEAVYPGGDRAFTKYLIKELTNSNYARYMKGINYYKVVIRFMVDKEGNIRDARTEEGTEPRLDKIAVSIIRDSGPWEPALQYNRRVNAYRRQPITFVVE